MAPRQKPPAKPIEPAARSNNSVATITAISAGIGTIITALALAWGSLHSGQVTAKAERQVERQEVSSELGRIHQQTNGHLSAMQKKVDDALREITELRKIISDRAIEQAKTDGEKPR